MKKTLLALALALAMASPAFAATSNVDIYGNVDFSVENSNVSGDSASTTSRGSYVGMKGSEDLGSGLTAVWQVERGFDATSGVSTSRDTFVGLNGTLGSVKAGVLSMPYRSATRQLEPFANTLADQNNFVGGVDFLSSTFDLRASQGVAYSAPAFHGLSLSAGFTFSDAPAFDQAVGTFDGYSLSGTYARGDIYAAVAYQNMSDVDSLVDGRQDSNALKVGVGYRFGNTKLGLIHEDVRGAVGDRDSWVANVTHSLGKADLKAEYGRVAELGDHAHGVTMGADYNLSKRTSAYALFAHGSEDHGDDVNAYGVGLRHSF